VGLEEESSADEGGRDATTEFAVKQESRESAAEQYKCELTAALIDRMHKFCRNRKILFVVLDIPHLGEDRQVARSSVPPQFAAAFEKNCDVLIRGTTVLRDYLPVMDVFVAHGQRHISETTHMLLGVACARAIKEQLPWPSTAKKKPSSSYE
jgi:hypothetical protein